MQVEDSAQGRITRWAMNRNTNTHHAMRIRVLSLLAALMLALGVLPAALAEDGQYGYVNFDNVRFRKQANDTSSTTVGYAKSWAPSRPAA